MPTWEIFRFDCAPVNTLPMDGRRLAEATADQRLGFAQQDSQRIPGGIGSDVARQPGCGGGVGTSNGLARD